MSSLWVESERATLRPGLQESHRFSGPARPRAPRAYADAAPGRDSAPVLAMLAKLGISPSRIAAAAQGARAQGVTAADYLIGNGYVSADTLYRGIARHLGMPFIGGKVPLRQNIDPYAAARRGVAPVVQDGAGGARIVVAPRGPALERLMSGAHPAENLRAPRALTTPDRLEDALRTHAGARLACDASEALSKLDPILSVRSGPTSAESGIALICLCAL